VRVRAVVSDLDGTMLEPDGSARVELREALRRLSDAGIPVCAVTSKTAAELRVILADLDLVTPAGFENGAGVFYPDGRIVLGTKAVRIAELRRVAVRVRKATGAPLRTLDELDDGELAALTALPRRALPAVRRRQASLPLVVAPAWDARIASSLPAPSHLRALRGNRFLHLQGDHDKASVLPALLAAAGRGDGAIVACGDSPNDVELIAHADLAVIVPGAMGPHPALLAARPDAIVAPAPHGLGWSAVLLELLAA
jgi:mannosyl-3-phosphoglycerate phosphatase